MGALGQIKLTGSWLGRVKVIPVLVKQLTTTSSLMNLFNLVVKVQNWYHKGWRKSKRNQNWRSTYVIFSMNSVKTYFFAWLSDFYSTNKDEHTSVWIGTQQEVFLSSIINYPSLSSNIYDPLDTQNIILTWTLLECFTNLNRLMYTHTNSFMWVGQLVS